MRKLGVPGHEELAMGAIATGGVRVLNGDVVRALRIPDEMLDRAAADAWQELKRRETDPKTGRRRNLGTFPSREKAEQHEREVQFFKRRG